MGEPLESPPEAFASERAQESAAQLLQSYGVKGLTETQIAKLTHQVIYSWVSWRVQKWCETRGLMRIGNPDAYTLAFTRSVLPEIGDLADTDEFPFNQPLLEWEEEEIVRMFAMVFELIEAQRVNTYEDANSQEFEMIV